MNAKRGINAEYMGMHDMISVIMECKLMMMRAVILFSILLSIISTSSVVDAIVTPTTQPQVPCYFIFGDSLVDNGNNNAGPNTTVKANYAPYGIDLPSEPRGRFTNGLTIADIIGQFLGFRNFTPPFLTARGNDTLRGVNYASAGAGISDETGLRRGATSLRRQIRNHLSIITNITRILGVSATPAYLKKCIYLVNIGSNDYLNNYFKPQEFPTSRIYTSEQYAVVLASQYSPLLQTLYLYGARKVAVFGLGRLGCIPIRLNGTSCAQTISDAATLFNTRVRSLVVELNRRLLSANFTYIDSTGLSNTTSTLLNALTNYGPCCEVASGEELCVPSGNVCANRNETVFWDAVHPAEPVNRIYAGVAYKAQSPSDAYPYDISQLAQM